MYCLNDVNNVLSQNHPKASLKIILKQIRKEIYKKKKSGPFILFGDAITSRPQVLMKFMRVNLCS